MWHECDLVKGEKYRYLGHFGQDKNLSQGHNVSRSRGRPKQTMSAGRRKLEAAMSEVQRNVPSTVRRARVSGAKREAMLRAVAFAKARKAGARLPRKGR